MPFQHELRQGLRDVYSTKLGISLSDEHRSAVQTTPFVLMHCEDDDVISVENGRDAAESLKMLGAQVQYHEFQVGGHEIPEPKGWDLIKGQMDLMA